MKVLVAGGAGLLGAAVCRRLLDGGQSVVVADAFAAEGDGRAVRGGRAAALKARGAAIRRVDLADGPILREVFEELRPEAVVNAARLPADASVAPLLQSAAEFGVGFLVHVSDADLYGAAPEPGWRARESEPLAPGDDPRLLARARDEESVRAGAIPSVVFRAFELVSADLPPGRVPREVADAVLAGIPVSLPDDEGRDFLHVDDAARAIHLALTRRPAGRTLNLGSGMAVSIRGLAEQIARAAGRSASFVVVPPPSRPPRVADLDAAWDALRFGPEVPLPSIASQLAVAAAAPPAAAVPARPEAAPEPSRPSEVSRRDVFSLFRKPFGPRK